MADVGDRVAARRVWEGWREGHEWRRRAAARRVHGGVWGRCAGEKAGVMGLCEGGGGGRGGGRGPDRRGRRDQR
jgi:hypothetical protein